MPSNCTIISWKGKKEMASLLKGSKGGGGRLWRGRDRDRGGAFRYSRRGLRLRRRGAYGIHRASGPRCQGLCRRVVHRFAQGAADWRSGPRWSILSVLCLVHPLPLRGVHPQGSVSLDSRVASLPYESSSLATSRGNEKIGGTGYCVTYDTER